MYVYSRNLRTTKMGMPVQTVSSLQALNDLNDTPTTKTMLKKVEYKLISLRFLAVLTFKTYSQFIAFT